MGVRENFGAGADEIGGFGFLVPLSTTESQDDRARTGGHVPGT